MSRGKSQVHTVFRRIVMDPAVQDGRPHIPQGRGKSLPVDEVVKRLAEGRTDAQIRKEFGHLSDNDLLLCRAWQVRFAPGTLSKEFNRVTSQNVFMLDENMPANLVSDVAKLFGRSSHVSAEGLIDEHNDDEKDIWAYMLRNKYKAILTADSDFTNISRRHRKAVAEKFGSLAKYGHLLPVVIHISDGDSRQHVLELLKKHQDDILDYIDKNDSAYMEVGIEGVRKVWSNAEIEGQARKGPGRGPK